MQKCSLCGGKVVNGRCEDCGLPIPPENRYTLRSETNRARNTDGEGLLHRTGQTPQRKPAQSRPGAPRCPAPAPAPPPADGKPARGTEAGQPVGSDGIIAIAIILGFFSEAISSLMS